MGYNWIVIELQIESVEKPFDDPVLARRTAHLIGRADAMGLLKDVERIDRLDGRTLKKVVKSIEKAGIGAATAPALQKLIEGSGKIEEIIGEINRLSLLLDESPTPEHEWPELIHLLGTDLLSELLGLSVSSIRRYGALQRRTPAEIVDRLHYVALLVGDLRAGYNEFGIRRWFVRPRTFLGDRSVLQALKKHWKPDDPVPQAIREDARWLLSTSTS